MRFNTQKSLNIKESKNTLLMSFGTVVGIFVTLIKSSWLGSRCEASSKYHNNERTSHINGHLKITRMYLVETLCYYIHDDMHISIITSLSTKMRTIVRSSTRLLTITHLRNETLKATDITNYKRTKRVKQMLTKCKQVYKKY